MRTSHRRCRKALQNFSRARDHHRESQPPQAAAHEIHSDQTGNQEIDVTRAWFSNPLFAGFHYVGAPFATLQDIVEHESRGTTLRSRRIEAIFKRIVLRYYDNR